MLYTFEQLLYTYGVQFVRVVNALIIIYFFALNGIYLFQLLVSRSGIFAHMLRLFVADYGTISRSTYTPPVSVIVPAFNEEHSILETVDSLRKLDYPEAEIVVVNDGSSDNTLGVLKTAYNLEPIDKIIKKFKGGLSERINTQPVLGVYDVQGDLGLQRLVVVDKIQGGKADALNAGILVSSYPYICSVDADSMLERDALIKVVKPIVERPDVVVASGGVVRVANGCKVAHGSVVDVELPRSSLAMFQIVEYLRAFLGSRFALGRMNALLIISGVFAMFRKDVVIAVGGYNRDSLVEDMELVVDVQRYLRNEKIEYDVIFVPDPIAWTEVPATLKSLARQRIRWHRGLMEVLLHNKGMLFNPHYGSLGFVALPYYFVFEALGPVIELFGYIAIPLAYIFGILQFPEFVLFIIAAFLFGSFLSVFALLLHENSRRQYGGKGDLARLILYGFLDNIVFRPLITVLRFIALVTFFRPERGWGEMEHKGFDDQERGKKAA